MLRSQAKQQYGSEDVVLIAVPKYLKKKINKLKSNLFNKDSHKNPEQLFAKWNLFLSPNPSMGFSLLQALVSSVEKCLRKCSHVVMVAPFPPLKEPLSYDSNNTGII